MPLHNVRRSGIRTRERPTTSGTAGTPTTTIREGNRGDTRDPAHTAGGRAARRGFSSTLHSVELLNLTNISIAELLDLTSSSSFPTREFLDWTNVSTAEFLPRRRRGGTSRGWRGVLGRRWATGRPQPQSESLDQAPPGASSGGEARGIRPATFLSRHENSGRNPLVVDDYLKHVQLMDPTFYQMGGTRIRRRVSRRWPPLWTTLGRTMMRGRASSTRTSCGEGER